jgi:hypothetical protein
MGEEMLGLREGMGGCFRDDVFNKCCLIHSF